MSRELRAVAKEIQEQNVSLATEGSDLLDVLSTSPGIDTKNCVVLVDKTGADILDTPRYKDLFDKNTNEHQVERGFIGSIMGMKVYVGDDSYKPLNHFIIYGPMPR